MRIRGQDPSTADDLTPEIVQAVIEADPCLKAAMEGSVYDHGASQ